jgi:pSer/pThr/pTyr-binding forkhead associated (FHA) protein
MRDPAQASSSSDSERARAHGADPSLVVISSGDLHGQTLELDGLERTVGRAADNDLRLDDPYTSRHHAVLRRAGSAVLVEDAGSTAGVHVNGQRIDGPALLRPGDVIRIGRTDLQLCSPGGAAAQPEATRAGMDERESPVSAGARFDVGAQRAEVISNVGRDQISYNQYALKFAPMRRRARTLIRLGVALVLGGSAIELLGFVRYLSVFREWISLLFSSGEVSPEQAGEVFSRLVSSAFPFFIAGMAMTLAGIACIVTGLLMRRRAREATR